MPLGMVYNLNFLEMEMKYILGGKRNEIGNSMYHLCHPK
jgi:hypothetical protein